ncbi:MAG TPA: molybdopterin cofactor-binding domain-containing protein [Pyrinomonadaceae bacterium]|nr:molybdopterin cofactor-binding domain-containing protein [Pyrinomonadaceae bacterium]
MKLTRRRFMQSSASAGAGLAITFYLPEAARGSEEKAFEPNAYIRITSDNVVTLWVTRSEMGQGVRTNLPAALAEELEVDLDKIRLEQAMPGARFKGIRLRTSGSGSSSGTFTELRKAGAAAREMLIAAALERWVREPSTEKWVHDRSTCRAQHGTVRHWPSGRSLTYGELAEAAAKQPIPTNPPLKNPSDFNLIGKPLRRLDAPRIVTGQAVYGIDVRVPGMLFAAMKRCPYLGGKVRSFDPKKARAVSGVRHVVPISKGISTGVAVVADNTWAAFKGCEALNVEWEAGANRDFDSDRFIAKLQSSFDQEGYPIRRGGDVSKAMASAAKKLEAVYVYPFQAHAPLETMNCVADVRRDSCEVWVPTQTPETAHQDIQKMLGLPPEAVKIHTTLLGGGFGRRLFVDYVHEAVELSQAIRKPVQLVWTRTDDMRNGFFHPASAEHLAAGLDTNGQITAWLHKNAGSDLSMFGLPTEEEKKDLQMYVKGESPWGSFDNPYNFPAMKVDYVPVDTPVPTGAWRAVEYPSTVFARESFIDEIAHAAGRDPVQLRIDLLQPGDVLALGEQKIDRRRMIRVLEIMREKSGWTKPLTDVAGRRRGRGMALNIYHAGSYMAQAAEVSVARDFSDIRVERIVCVFDCGLPINPAGLEGQVESGITWGLSATLHGKIDFRNGMAQQGTYSDFRVMRMNEMPLVETYIIPSNARPGGFGEHPVPPVAPAVANAVFAATGKRIRRLPIRADDLPDPGNETMIKDKV